MKLKLILAGLAVMMGSVAHATLYSFDFTGINAAIPDANPGGYADTRTVNLGVLPEGVINSISDVNVKLNITGGYNGDLYGYLVHDSGFAVLLNRVGTGLGGQPQFSFGYSDAGLNIKLDDQIANNIHNYQAVGGYATTIGNGSSWGSDGGTLSSFNTLSANGTWTLFLADLSSGEQSQLSGWSLEIDVVPEPTQWAMGIFAAMMVVTRFFVRRKGGR